ncbi:RNA-directed DNA polymerase, eukaryota, reverse transcriptase zinc-binding domain protein, partial [Tanacetum coccineum]
PTEIDNDGNEFVIFDEEMFEGENKRWELIMCGYFVGHQMFVNELKYNVKRLWGKYGLSEVIDKGNGIFKFKFSKSKGISFVIENGPWMLPIWVKMSNTPFEAWSAKGISALASRIGKPLIMDAVTAGMCQDGMVRKGFARVLVKVDALKELPSKIDVAYKNKGNEIIGTKMVQVSYNWKRPRCGAETNANKSVEGFSEVTSKRVGKQRNKRSHNNVNVNGVDPKHVSGGNKTKRKNDVVTQDSDRNKNKFDVLREYDENGMNENDDMHNDNKTAAYEEDDVLFECSGMASSMEDNEVISFDTNVCSTLETHLKSKKLVRACEKAFGNWDWISNMHLYNKGCIIIIGWNRDMVIVRCIHMSGQTILCIIKDIGSHLVSFVSFVYAANRNIDRRNFWAKLNKHKQITNRKQWIIGGDMNVILNTNEHSAGVSFVINEMQEFRDCVNMIEVEDMCSSGLFFTWTKNLKKAREGNDTGVLKKLDRVMVNEEFMKKFNKAHVIFNPYIVSDHSQAVVAIPNGMKKKKKKKAFKFANYIAEKYSFIPVVEL